MKTRHLLQAAVLVLWTTPAFAQTAPPAERPLTRADLSGSLGWFNASKADLDSSPYNDWYGRSLHGGVAAGWYWTDHLKSEIDVSGTTNARLYGYPPVVIGGHPGNTAVEYVIGTRKLAVTQLYQGLRNQWVHPYAGLGVEMTWERITEHHGPTFIFDPVVRTTRQVLPERTIGPRTDLVARPVGSLGLKAYVTSRAFIRGDLRIAFRGGIDEVLLRCGFGVDF